MEQRIFETIETLRESINRVFIGKEDVVEDLLVCLMAGGHVLLEDVPGVGKTSLAGVLAKTTSCSFGRIQFTPDVMPSDLLGFNMYQKETGGFTYYPGTIMCNLFLADEINRTSPKTQSALLEVMEEGIVTVDGVSRDVPKPFFVMATQNPKGSAGTQLLPEAQLDRFMICMSMGYPDESSEIEIAKGKHVHSGDVKCVLCADELAQLQEEAEQVYVHDSLYRYIVNLSQATRENDYIALGISPRGSIACTKMAKAWAFLQKRSYVIPEDVAAVFPETAKHRILLNTKARVTHLSQDAVNAEVLDHVRQPVSYSAGK